MNYTFNGKNIRIPDDIIEKMVKLLGITKEEAIQTWLEDEGFLENPEQIALCQKAKESGIMRTIHAAKAITPVKTQRERVKKENPTKEKIIAEIAKLIAEFAENVTVVNDSKIIEFSMGDKDFKLDLTQKRKKKGE